MAGAFGVDRGALPEAEVSGELFWWKLAGSYASALVAASSFDRAVELMSLDKRSNGWGPWDESGPIVGDEPLPEELPGPPSVEGVYHVYGE